MFAKAAIAISYSSASSGNDHNIFQRWAGWLFRDSFVAAAGGADSEVILFVHLVIYCHLLWVILAFGRQLLSLGHWLSLCH
jgi:hypothetical protein